MRLNHTSVSQPVKRKSFRPAESRPHEPFASLPHAIAGDPSVSPLAKTVLLALLYWARGNPSCWPSNGSIGRRVGRSAATVQRTLRSLERLGLIERQRADNPTGREIVLVWKVTDRSGASDAPTQAPVTPPPAPPMTTEGDVTVGEAWKEPVEAQIPRQRPEPTSQDAPVRLQEAHRAIQAIPRPNRPALQLKAVTSPPGAFDLTAAEQGRLADLSGPVRDEVLAWLATGDPILAGEARKRLRPPPTVRPAPASTAELLLRVREDPSHVLAAAELLSREFDDRKSFGGFHARLRDAWEGRMEPESLAAAYREAIGPKVRNRGAVFMHRLSRGRL